MKPKYLTVIFLLILAIGLIFYSRVVVEARILNILLHDPNELIVNIDLQNLFKREKFLQAATEILGFGSAIAGLVVLFAISLNKKKSN